MVKALSELFTRNRSIKAAYLAQFFNPERDERPHILIGIDAEADWGRIVGEAGMVASEVVGHDEIVDFIRIDDAGVSRYMTNQTKPFYKKSLLRGMFS